MMMEQWYSLSEGSRKLGYSRNYINMWLLRHGKFLPKEMIFEIGGRKVISEQGIEFIRNNTKKLGDHLRAVTLSGLQNKARALFLPKYSLYQNKIYIISLDLICQLRSFSKKP